MNQRIHQTVAEAMRNSIPQSASPLNQANPTNAEIREMFLQEVKQLVCKDRNITHGDAEDNFAVIARMWTAYLGFPVDSLDVSAMMCLFKVSRLKANKKNMENWHDLAGYAACGGGIARKA